MKKSLIALASVAALGAAHADVTLYGLLDLSVGTISSAGSSDANNPGNVNVYGNYPGATNSGNTNLGGSALYNGRVTSMINGYLAGSRWGIKGEENLGGGLKANFTLESALNVAAGTNPNDHLFEASSGSAYGGAGDSAANGQMFDRQSTIGLSGDFGSVDAGFQAVVAIDANAAIDPFSLGGISPVGFYSSWNGGGSSYTRMASNSIKYKYSMGQSMIEGFYAFGGQSGNAGAGSQVGLMAKVQASPSLTLVVAAQRMNDDVSFSAGGNITPVVGPTSAVTGLTTSTTYNVASGTLASTAAGVIPALTATYYNSTTTILGGAWKASSNLELKGGYISIVQSNPNNGSADTLITQNNGIPINPNTLNVNPYPTNYQRQIAFVGGTYDFDATHHLTLGYYNANLNSYTKNAYGVTSGTLIQQPLTALPYTVIAAAYKVDLSKTTMVYAAGSYQNFPSVNATTSTAVTGAGPTATTQVAQSGFSGTSQSTLAVGIMKKF
jgi:predicted porin